MFFHKKEPETDKLINNFINEVKFINAAIAKIEAKLESLEIKQNSLRGLINRKVPGAEEPTESDIKSDGFDFLRKKTW